MLCGATAAVCRTFRYGQKTTPVQGQNGLRFPRGFHLRCGGKKICLTYFGLCQTYFELCALCFFVAPGGVATAWERVSAPAGGKCAFLRPVSGESGGGPATARSCKFRPLHPGIGARCSCKPQGCGKCCRLRRNNR